MHNESIQQEAFSISFNGPAFDGHDIPAAALAQSLLALDGLSRRAAEAAYLFSDARLESVGGHQDFGIL